MNPLFGFLRITFFLAHRKDAKFCDFKFLSFTHSYAKFWLVQFLWAFKVDVQLFSIKILINLANPKMAITLVWTEELT